MSLAQVIAQERRRQRAPLFAAAGSSALAGGASVALLGLSGWFITGAAAAGATGAALAFNYMLPSAAIRLLAIIRTAGRYGERLEGHRAALYALAHIRPRLFAALASAPPFEALALSTGEASARLVQDVDAVQTLFVRRSASWGAAAAVVTGVALAAVASPAAAGAVALSLGAYLIGAYVLARRLSAGPGRIVQAAAGRLKDVYAALLAAAPELVCYGLQDWAAEQVQASAADMTAARRALDRADGWQAALAHFAAALAAASALLAAQAAPLPLAALAALAAAAAMEGAGSLARAFASDGAARAARQRLDSWLAAAAPASPAPPLAAEIEIRADGEVIHLAPGARLAVIGPSGGGKTTLIEQLIGLRTAPTRRLRVGGVDPADTPIALRALFAYAPQDAALLSGTVRDNLLLGRPEAEDAELWDALADAALQEHVRRLLQGLDTWIGEGGARLSGGEQRRLSLARALLRPAPWLLLDEPTEGLDATTEALVTRRLDERLKRTGQGLILVTHRPALLVLCDRVLYIAAEAERESGRADAA